MKPETIKYKNDWNIKKVYTEQTKDHNKNTRARCEISSNLTTDTRMTSFTFF